MGSVSFSYRKLGAIPAAETQSPLRSGPPGSGPPGGPGGSVRREETPRRPLLGPSPCPEVNIQRWSKEDPKGAQTCPGPSKASLSGSLSVKSGLKSPVVGGGAAVNFSRVVRPVALR